MKTFLVITSLLLSLTAGRAGFLDQLQALATTNKISLSSSNLAGLSQDQMVQGLKEALGKGVQTAVANLGRNAEQAVPEAANVFSDSIKQMTITDAKNILTGTNNAATEYFRRTTQTNLYAKFLPIVKAATDKVGVTAAYKNMMGKAAISSQFSGLLGSTGLVKPEDMDIDAYVTHKAMDGLFTMVAAEEKRIRENPVARTTEVLKRVFGAVAK